MFKLQQDQLAKLAEYRSSYRLCHNAEQGVVCKIVDLLTKSDYHFGTGPTEPEAVANALDTLTEDMRPRSGSQMQEVLSAKDEEIALLKAQLEAATNKTAKLDSKPTFISNETKKLKAQKGLI